MISRKSLFLLVFTSFSFSLTSCDKSYICECTVTLGSMTTTQTSLTTDVSSRAKAKKICEQKTNLDMIPKTECSLKE